MNHKNDEYYIDINKAGSLPESVVVVLQYAVQQRSERSSARHIDKKLNFN